MDLTQILIIAFICVAIGYIAGTMIATLRGEKPAPASEELAAGQPAVVESPPAPGAAADNPKRVEVAALWRERPTGALRVDLQGQTLRTSTELNPDQRAKLLEVSGDLQAWLAVNPLSAPQPVQVDPAPTAAYVPPPPLPAPLPSVLPGAPAAGQPPAKVDPKAKVEPKSIVNQIDDILQAELQNTPLAKRGIRLTEEANFGVVVWVGLERFVGIDAVTDVQIRSVIRKAVSMWENQVSAKK